MLNRSEEAYINIIESSIRNYDEQIEAQREIVDSLDSTAKKERVRLKTLESERERLQQELDNVRTVGMDENLVLDDLSDKIDKIEENVEDKTEQISELEDAREQITSRFADRIVDKKIVRLHRKIDNLQNKAIRIGAVQQVILISKVQKDKFINHFKNINRIKTETNIEDLESKIESNQTVMDNVLDPDHNIVDKVRSKILSVQNGYYLNKHDKAVEKLARIEEGKDVLYFGATVTEKAIGAVKAASDRLVMLKMSIADGIRDAMTDDHPTRTM